MNRLPDMIIIDFCEWLNHYITESTRSDVLDFILDDRNEKELYKYADRYLRNKHTRLKNILHKFIDSDFFDDYLNRIHLKSFRSKRDIYSDDQLICYMFCREELCKCFHRFCRDNYDDYTIQLNNITPEELVDSSRMFFSDTMHENNTSLHLMNRLNIDMQIEIDFITWLTETNGNQLDIQKMPVRVFSKIADEFARDCNKTKSERDKLIRSFKQKDLKALSRKLMALLPIKTIKAANDLGYIIGRYSDKRIPFKCIIIPLKANSKEYIDLIENYWEDFHYLSGDYLDIYYSDTDYGKSGFEIMKQMNYIPETLKEQAPSIIIWGTELSKAKRIDISRLNNTDIFEIIQKIVNLIKSSKSLDTIVKEANIMSDELRDKHRAISNTNNTVINSGTINGNVVNENSGTLFSDVSEVENTIPLANEINDAQRLISSFNDINDQQKELLLGILKETSAAVKSGNEKQKQDNKKRFKDAICFMGDIGTKLISALSGLTNLLKYFNITPF